MHNLGMVWASKRMSNQTVIVSVINSSPELAVQLSFYFLCSVDKTAASIVINGMTKPKNAIVPQQLRISIVYIDIYTSTRLTLGVDQAPKDIRKYSSVAVVCKLHLCHQEKLLLSATNNFSSVRNNYNYYLYLSVKANDACERLASVRGDSDILARFNISHIVWKVDSVTFMACQSEGVCILSGLETQGHNSHAHQIATMYSLEALCYNCFDTLKQCTHFDNICYNGKSSSTMRIHSLAVMTTMRKVPEASAL